MDWLHLAAHHLPYSMGKTIKTNKNGLGIKDMNVGRWGRFDGPWGNSANIIVGLASLPLMVQPLA